MVIQPNKITALVGLSGAGKSTLISLLDKFYPPAAGQIQLDGIDLQDIDTQYLREHIGLVLQKNHIFQGTIFENIRYGKTDASLEEVIVAAKKASIHEQISQLAKTYETDALMLSGGQQQRIALARMFLKNPPIIFLDEPTVGVDIQSKIALLDYLQELHQQGMSIVYTSHHMAEAEDFCTQVTIMNQGKSIVTAEPKELIKQVNAYNLEEAFVNLTKLS